MEPQPPPQSTKDSEDSASTSSHASTPIHVSTPDPATYVPAPTSTSTSTPIYVPINASTSAPASTHSSTPAQVPVIATQSALQFIHDLNEPIDLIYIDSGVEKNHKRFPACSIIENIENFMLKTKNNEDFNIENQKISKKMAEESSLNLRSISDTNNLWIYHLDQPVCPLQKRMTISISPTVITAPVPDPHNISVVIPRLRDSFKHELTEVGRSTLQRLERDLLNRFGEWNKEGTELIAPIVSLCQSSGSGKSKMSLELLKKHLGFYIVFRQTEDSGYPFQNSLSDTLQKMVEDYKDPPLPLDKTCFNECAVGRILNFFGTIIVSSISSVVESCKENDNESFEIIVEAFARKFEQNENLNFELVDQEFMNSLYNVGSGSKVVTVEQVAIFIKSVLDEPALFFSARNIELDPVEKKICEEIQHHLGSFPFLFVIDEAEFLSKIRFKIIEPGVPATGFEAFRRAISYIEVDSKVLFLTLGTKSNVLDLNPDVVYNSLRFEKRKRLPAPIILSSNSNICFKEFPLSLLQPTYKMLRNPLILKFLCTLGHGIWCSLPFDTAVSTARTKLTNGTSKTFDYVIPIWMIRAGMQANPFHIDSGTLVASHMATLLDITPDLKQLMVTYPSEPILAIASRDLTNSLPGDQLFRVLKNKLESISIDRGRVAETFAAMVILRAIDISPTFVLPVSDLGHYRERLNEINEIAPEYKDIWESEKYILQPVNIKNERGRVDDLVTEAKAKLGNVNDEIENYNIIRPQVFEDAEKENIVIKLKELGGEKERLDKYLRELIASHTPLTGLSDYKVCRVKDFLLSLLGPKFDFDIAGIPEAILNAVVNVTHFVNLARDSKGFHFVDAQFKPDNLPLSDDRIPDRLRNIIDVELLKIGLNRQCGFALPAGYYGIDYIIPICFENGVYSFIAIQVKSANANSQNDIFKMQARLHLVKCSDSSCSGAGEKKNKKKCPRCIDQESLEFIFKNQLSILVSLDERNSYFNFTEDRSFFQNCKSKKDRDVLYNALNVQDPKLEDLHSIKVKNSTFFEPLLHDRVCFEELEDVMLSKTIWDDNHVNLKRISVGKKSIPFVSDKFLHRQYCIATRGWDVFRRLFKDFESSIDLAQEIMSTQTLFRNAENRNNPDHIRKAIFDLSPAFVEYSEELALARGKSSRLDDLEFQEFPSNTVFKSKISGSAPRALDLNKKHVPSMVAGPMKEIHIHTSTYDPAALIESNPQVGIVPPNLSKIPRLTPSVMIENVKQAQAAISAKSAAPRTQPRTRSSKAIPPIFVERTHTGSTDVYSVIDDRLKRALTASISFDPVDAKRPRTNPSAPSKEKDKDDSDDDDDGKGKETRRDGEIIIIRYKNIQ